jgi:hypothetical protein
VDDSFWQNALRVKMAASGWIGERQLCGFAGGDHPLVKQTFISPGHSL